MSRFKHITSLKELLNLIKSHKFPNKLIVFFDLDLTLIQEKDDISDELIEPEITKELFDYILKNKIGFSFVTARFHNTVCSERKRNLKEMRQTIEDGLFPIFEDLGIDCECYKKEINPEAEIIKNDKGKTVGILFHGIFFGIKKGELIKHYMNEHGLNKTHPFTFFIDDLESNLKNVRKHIPGAIVIRRDLP
jgi:hypothetical protein